MERRRHAEPRRHRGLHAGFDDGAEPDAEARLLWATCGGVRVASVYIPNGREVDSDHYRYKLAWLARLRAHLEKTC